MFIIRHNIPDEKLRTHDGATEIKSYDKYYAIQLFFAFVAVILCERKCELFFIDQDGKPLRGQAIVKIDEKDYKLELEEK